MAYTTQTFPRQGGFSVRRFIAGLFVVTFVTAVAAGAVVLSPLSNNARALTFHSSVVDRGSLVTIAPGTTANVTLRFRNAGLTSWERGVSGSQVDLGVKGDSLEFAKVGMAVGWLSDTRIVTTIEAVVPPGADGTFTFAVRAPSTLGLYRIPVRLVVNDVTWLEDQETFVVVASDFGFHDELVDQSRHPTLRVGETSGPITVKLRNTGTRAWLRGQPGQQVNLGLEGNDATLKALAMGWPSGDRVAIQTESTVAPGDAATFAFRVRAPSIPGTYALRLRPVVDGVTWLEGDGVLSLITVTAASGQAPQPQTGSASFTSTASVAQESVAAGALATITVAFKSTSTASALLGVEIYSPGGGNLAYQKWFDEQSFVAGEQRVFPVTWQVPTNAVLGTYSVSLRAFAPGWKSMYSSKDNAATLSIAAPLQAALPTTAPGGSTPTASPPGGSGQGQTGPTPTPSPSAAPSFASSASVTPASVTLGSAINVSASFTSATPSSVLVSVSIYSPGGVIAVTQQTFDNQHFGTGQTRSFPVAWTLPASAATGTYRVSLGVFSPGYGTQYSWNDSAATFAVTAVPATPAPTPAATATPAASSTSAPTATPTSAPTATPTSAPTATPTSAPTATPTAAPTPTPSPPPSVVYLLQLTSSPDGSGASALAGRIVTGGIYVFVNPASGVTQVRFNVDGVLVRTENLPPFTLAGDTAGLASPFDTTTLSNGAHNITASIDRSGGTDVLSAAVTVSNVAVPTPPPPPPPSSGCPSPAYTRLINVSTVSQLNSAVAASLPGDKIVMAPGTYNMGGSLNISRGGTGTQPIQLVGPRTAVLEFGGTSLYNYLTITADWWIFAGFTHTHSQLGPRLTNANNNVLCDLLVEHLGQGGISMHGTSSFNTVQDSTIRDTGEITWWYGEGFYIGSGASSNEPANYNRILRNHIGPNVRAEHIDLKNGTTGNTVEGNVSDATGWRWTNGSDSGGQVTSSVHLAQGLNQTYLNNSVINLNSPSAAAYMNWQGSGVKYHGNSASGSFQVGFSTNGGSGNVVGCDNAVTGGAFANVPCQ